MEDGRNQYLDAAVTDALRSISHTLTRRLEVPLGEKDSLAVAAALRSAAGAGVRLGVGEMSASLIESGHDVRVELVLDDVDAWAARYGADEPER